MLLIDSLYINNSGGKILLDYLVAELEKNNIEVFYLFDLRCKSSYGNVPKNKKLYLKATLRNRYKFYNAHKLTISKVLCFGNFPPSIRLTAKVYTYFHQAMFLCIPKEFSFTQKITFWAKSKVLKSLTRNTDFWLVQSKGIKKSLESKYKLSPKKVLIVPFFPTFEYKEIVVRKKNTYLYVSGASPHKNHKALIEAFCIFYKKHNIGELILTVGSDFPEIENLIDKKRKKGYPITNIGFIDRNDLEHIYKKSEYLIFPSLAESFGLGLIEAIECGCKVIGADLPYTYEVCEPSLVFNPLDDESFMQAFENSLIENVKISIPKIKNNINELINILQDSSCN